MRRPARWRAWLKRIAPLVAIVRHARAHMTPIGRGRRAAERRGAALLQPSTVTRMDRHPHLVAAVAARLGPRPWILSFGCSTGEEAFTLARAIGDARIDAIDANPACIARAERGRARSEHGGRIRFACADAPDAFARTYDAIFCLSVLRHGDLDMLRPVSSTALMPFARFAATIDALDRCLRPGGMLILWGCHFRFEDSAVHARYRAVPTPGVAPQSGPFYGPDDRAIPDAVVGSFVFVKTG